MAAAIRSLRIYFALVGVLTLGFTLPTLPGSGGNGLLLVLGAMNLSLAIAFLYLSANLLALLTEALWQVNGVLYGAIAMSSLSLLIAVVRGDWLGIVFRLVVILWLAGYLLKLVKQLSELLKQPSAPNRR